MRRIKVRFNLGRGKNYMKWKVEYSKGVSEYYDPKEVQLMMDNCVLKNHKGTSKKIYEGSNKTVCAWVLCETIKLLDKEINMSYLNGDRIQYNPKIKPNWVINDDIVDDVHFEKIVSFENKLFNIH